MNVRFAIVAAGISLAALAACAQAGKGFATTDEPTTQGDAATNEPVDEQDGSTQTYGNDSGVLKPDPGKDAGSDPDTGPTCAKLNNACGVDPQCGCSSLETCDLDSNGTAGCISAGVAQLGRACAGTQSCARGLTCVFGTCRPFCSNANAACAVANTNVCTQVTLQDGGAVPNFKVCQVDCDLRDPNACGGTNAAGTAGCVHDGQGHTDCEAAGTVAENNACSNAARCAPGLICVYPSNQPNNLRCKKWCRVGVSADCGGQTCTGFSTKVMVGSVEYGSCP